MHLRILIILFFIALAARAVADETPVTAEEDPESDQSDMYYSAMIRSIDLDKNRWKPLSRTMATGPWFYDSQGLVRTGSTVKTTVTVFPHPLKTELYQSVLSNHTKIRKIVFETEINCSKHLYRQPEISVYGYYNELLTWHANKNRKFSPIKQGTTTDTLQGLVCVTTRKKKK